MIHLQLTRSLGAALLAAHVDRSLGAALLAGDSRKPQKFVECSQFLLCPNNQTNFLIFSSCNATSYICLLVKLSVLQQSPFLLERINAYSYECAVFLRVIAWI
jgi:hypothetical protein